MKKKEDNKKKKKKRTKAELMTKKNKINKNRHGEGTKTFHCCWTFKSQNLLAKDN